MHPGVLGREGGSVDAGVSVDSTPITFVRAEAGPALPQGARGRTSPERPLSSTTICAFRHT